MKKGTQNLKKDSEKIIADIVAEEFDKVLKAEDDKGKVFLNNVLQYFDQTLLIKKAKLAALNKEISDLEKKDN